MNRCEYRVNIVVKGTKVPMKMYMKRPFVSRSNGPLAVSMATMLAFLAVLCLSGTVTVEAEPYSSMDGVGIHIGGAASLGMSEALRCPKICTCSGQTVDCSHRGLTQVPRRIPLDTERL